MMETGSHSKEKTYRCMTDVLAICEFDDLLVESAIQTKNFRGVAKWCCKFFQAKCGAGYRHDMQSKARESLHHRKCRSYAQIFLNLMVY